MGTQSMPKILRFHHNFVESIPHAIDDGILYVSVRFATAIHKCACGCGEEVVTPFTPTDWKLIFDGENITLNPSIGNWSFKCRSHYWIKNGKVIWAESWSDNMINSNRAYDHKVKNSHYKNDDKGIWGKVQEFIRSKLG